MFTEKFKLESNFQNFTKSCFTSVLCHESTLNLIHVISTISREITMKLASFSLKITKNEENCHSWISCFTQMVMSDIIFTLDLHEFYSQPITLCYLKYFLM